MSNYAALVAEALRRIAEHLNDARISGPLHGLASEILQHHSGDPDQEQVEAQANPYFGESDEAGAEPAEQATQTP